MKHTTGPLDLIRLLRYVDSRLSGYPQYGTLFKADAFIRNGAAYYQVDDDLVSRKFILLTNPGYVGIDGATAQKLIQLIDGAEEVPGYLELTGDAKLEEEFCVLMMMRLAFGM